MKLDLLALDDHTRRQVWRDPETGRMFTRRADEGKEVLREVDTVTIRHQLDGTTSVVVAYTERERCACGSSIEGVHQVGCPLVNPYPPLRAVT